MRIFVAYSLTNDWIPQQIFPLIQSLGFEIESGKELAGQSIDEAIKRKIDSCDGLVAFFTKITPIAGSDLFKPSDWVAQEYTYAEARGILLLEVRETNVDFQGRLAGNRQWIDLHAGDRLLAAVELCRALREWRKGIDVELRLRTQAFVDAIRGSLSGRKYRCVYVMRHRNGKEIARIADACILPRSGGLFVYAKNVPVDAFIEFRVEFNGQIWTSLGRELQTIDIDLEREGLE
jgi:hypothetical protein